MLIQKVCIVGAGLMGGSLAIALRPFIPHLTIVDHSVETRTACAEFADVVTGNFADGVRDATFVILASPPAPSSAYYVNYPSYAQTAAR